MVVTICNWRAFNPRADVKRPSWFRLSHDLFEDSDFYDFAPSELLSWIYLLCQASRKNSDSVRVNIQHLERVGRIKEKDFLSAIRKLEELRIITVDVTDEIRARDVHDTPTNATYVRTNETNITYTPNAPSASRQVLDFDSLYRKYPRKEGKAKGIAACKAQIKGPEDYAALSQAIDRYAAHCKRSATEAKYIKHFSTFMGSWRDWLEPETGSVPGAAAAIDWGRVFKGEKDAV